MKTFPNRGVARFGIRELHRAHLPLLARMSWLYTGDHHLTWVVNYVYYYKHLLGNKMVPFDCWVDWLVLVGKC